MTTGAKTCCVAGCEKEATHRRGYTIVADSGGEIGVRAAFCCEHVDMVWSEEGPPFLDLAVTGVIRS